MKQFIH